MVKIQKISEIEPCLGFTEFDMLKKYRQSFATSELGRLHSLFPFSELARQMHLKSSPLGRKSYFSPEGKIALMVCSCRVQRLFGLVQLIPIFGTGE